MRRQSDHQGPVPAEQASRSRLVIGERPSGLYTPRYRGSRREFCGPTAIAAVTGADFDDIRDAIRQASGKIERADGSAHPVMGISNETLIGAMALLGWQVTAQDLDRPMRRSLLTEWLEARPATSRFRLGDFLNTHGNDGPWIVNVIGHYHAVAHGEICDTYTKLPIDIARCRRRGQWVQHWWKFTQADPSYDSVQAQVASIFFAKEG